jgi:septum formation protein
MEELPDVILASTSPRRKELLTLGGVGFTVRTGHVSEEYEPGTPPAEVPEMLARRKALAARALSGAADIILGADTIVLVEDTILGKPADTGQAVEYLRLLSGKVHHVITGVCLVQGERIDSFSVDTRVFFRELSSQDIDYYVTHYSPLDKAGAYAIQEWIGVRGVERIEGDYFNVVGLPVSEVIARLRTFTGEAGKG